MVHVRVWKIKKKKIKSRQTYEDSREKNEWELKKIKASI